MPAVYARRGGSLPGGVVDPVLLELAFRQRMSAAMQMPSLEALFPSLWTPAARRVLPSLSPQLPATAMWGPLLGWCVLELLAEASDAGNPARAALDLFDRLRLREPLAGAFAALGFEGDDAWRVAARFKVLLLVGRSAMESREAVVVDAVPMAAAAKAESERASTPEKLPEISVEEKLPKIAQAGGAMAEGAASSRVAAVAPIEEASASQPSAQALAERVGFAADLWLDPDLRWLAGVHEAEGHFYLVREAYEELLWWLQVPSLLDLAGEAKPARERASVLAHSIDGALAAAEAAGFRVDVMQGRQMEVLQTAPKVEEVDLMGSTEANQSSSSDEEAAAKSVEG
jgi:hypothetical protein